MRTGREVKYKKKVCLRLILVVRAPYTAPARLAEPDGVGGAGAHRAPHLVGVDGGIKAQARPREGRERGFTAGNAEAAVPVAEDDGGRRFDRAVL